MLVDMSKKASSHDLSRRHLWGMVELLRERKPLLGQERRNRHPGQREGAEKTFAIEFGEKIQVFLNRLDFECESPPFVGGFVRCGKAFDGSVEESRCFAERPCGAMLNGSQAKQQICPIQQIVYFR